MKRVTTAAALNDLRDATMFYKRKAAPHTALLFLAEFERSTSLLLNSPQIGTPLRNGLRAFRLRRFPYTIIYAIAQDQVRVIAVAHQRRLPGYWVKRG